MRKIFQHEVNVTDYYIWSKQGDNNPLFKLIKTIKDVEEKPTKFKEEVKKLIGKDEYATFEKDSLGEWQNVTK